jgi:hypothetical protein
LSEGCAPAALSYGLRVPVVRSTPLLVLIVLLLTGCDHGSNDARSNSQSPFTKQEVRRAFAQAGLPLTRYDVGFTNAPAWKITAVFQSGFDITVALYEREAPSTFVTINDQRVLFRRNVSVNYPARSRKLPRIKRALALLRATQARLTPVVAKQAIVQRAREWSSGGNIVGLTCRPDPADSGAITCDGSPVECGGGTSTNRWSVHRGAEGEPVIDEPNPRANCIALEDSEASAGHCESHPYVKCDATEP